ncbi:MAG: glucose-1-phosphate cytidylyltransferase [Elusimicrobia bacterium RBG_16_66_12]|nr:MAG: glucose-1-phosphate cytidylyltransferase [Elusimicrobia bacterium RBG_16_66_12]
MKVSILAGGLGSRLSEMTDRLPKPMVEIGGQPILWHIMKHYAHFGLHDFVVALGYKGEVIKDYFVNYHLRSNNLSVRLKTGAVEVSEGGHEDWTVHLLDTGGKTQTGGRVRRVMQSVGRQPLLLTYGDGVSNVDIRKLLKFHRAHGKLATVTAMRPPARFGALQLRGDRVTKFVEKPQVGDGWINGGFFVLEPRVVDYIAGDSTLFEKEPLERLAREGQLVAYRHDDFWQCMDTVRDVRLLEDLWNGGNAPWKLWKR